MAQPFNISTVFSAVNHLSQPMHAMTQQMSQFARAANASTGSLNQSLNSTGTAVHGLQREIANLNTLRFDGLVSRLNGLSRQLSNTARGFQNAGNAAIGLGGSGMAAVWGLNKLIDPVAEAQRAAVQLAVVYGQGKSLPEQKAIGKQQYEITAGLANKLPGNVADIADFRSLSKSYGVEGNYELIRGFTDALGRMGKSTLDNEVISAIQSVMIGNQSDLFEKTGLKNKSDAKRGNYLYERDTGERHFFKNDAEKFTFLSKYLHKRYAGGTEISMDGVDGLKSNFGDAYATGVNKIWEDSGALTAYNLQLKNFTKMLGDAVPKLTAVIKPVAEWATANKEMVSNVILAAPAMVGLGVGLKAVGFVISGLVLPIRALTAGLVGLRVAFTFASAVTGIAVAPLAAMSAALVGLAAAAYGVYSNWGEIIDGFKQMKAKVTADFAAWKLPKLDFSAVWNPLRTLFSESLKLITSTWLSWGLPPLDFSAVWDPLRTLFSESLKLITSTWLSWGLPPLDFSAVWDGLLSGFTAVINTIKSIWASMPKMTAPGVSVPKTSNVVPFGLYAKQKDASASGIYGKQSADSVPKSIYTKPDYLMPKSAPANVSVQITNKNTPTGIQTTARASSPTNGVKLDIGLNKRGSGVR
jgi:hypothetical protein